MGVLNAGNRYRESDWAGYGGGLDIRRRVDLVLCDPGTPDARENDETRNQAGRHRIREGRPDQGSGRTLGYALRDYWRGSCMAVNHRLCEAEERAEKLARSLGIGDKK